MKKEIEAEGNSRTGIVKAICISERKGIQKHEVDHATFQPDYGIEGDAHAGRWHRQVSLLSDEKIQAFNQKGADVKPGAFGENLVVSGFDFQKIPIGTRFGCGTVVLELTQHGKECHSHCEIYKKMGECIMPTQGTFAEVIQGGTIHRGDVFERLTQRDERYTAAVVTLSDSGVRGEREDKSGPLIADTLEKNGYRVVEQLMLPDQQKKIEQQLIRLADSREVNLIITTGGTGFSQTDCTPEATLAVAHKNAPGIAEAIRNYSMTITKRAMLSREASVIRGNTLIINLPGSPKAVTECMDCFLDQLPHGLGILTGKTGNCAR